MIYQIWGFMMSVITWDRVHFEYIFRTTTHKVTRLDQLIDIRKGNNSQKYFEQFGVLGLIEPKAC